MASRAERAAYASFSLSVWTRERNCVVCGNPGSNAHHVMRRGSPYFGESVVANGVMLCGSGTMGCHGAFHGGDLVVAKAIGEYIVRQRPDTVEYVLGMLGDEQGRDFFRRIYGTEVKMSAPTPGKVDAAIVVLYQDELGEHRWRAMDTNHEIVADSGEGYVSRSYAEKAATDLFPNAEVVVEIEEGEGLA